MTSRPPSNPQGGLHRERILERRHGPEMRQDQNPWQIESQISAADPKQ